MWCKVLSESKPKARKQHDCNASLFITEGGKPDYFDCIQDYRDYINARNKRFKIEVGDIYIRQSMVCDGDFHCAKSIPEMHLLCIKYELYGD